MTTMLKRSTLGVLLVGFLALVSAGCFPGNHGWSCDSDAECRAGLRCKTFGNVFKGSYCVEYSAHQIRSSSTYGWPKLVFFWTVLGTFSLAAVYMAGVRVVEKIRGH
jgi:hypothetical protein